VFGPGTFFQVSLEFLTKAGAYPSEHLTGKYKITLKN
jgi:hypothetical protein